MTEVLAGKEGSDLAPGLVPVARLHGPRSVAQQHTNREGSPVRLLRLPGLAAGRGELVPGVQVRKGRVGVPPTEKMAAHLMSPEAATSPGSITGYALSVNRFNIDPERKSSVGAVRVRSRQSGRPRDYRSAEAVRRYFGFIVIPVPALSDRYPAGGP